MTSNQGESVERALAALLDALAPLLIGLYITPDRLAQISRASFVKAGAGNARKRSSGKPHLARIAALTGLPRSEVKRIVANNFSIGTLEPESMPRALRVLNAWNQSRRFKASGRPRRLKIVGPRDSFAALCKAYSGDIPHRVILSELERAGHVKLSPKRTHVRVVPAANNSRSRAARESLAYAASFLRHALSNEYLLIRRKQRIPTSSLLPNSYVEEAISGRLNELLDQFPSLFPSKRSRERKSINVYALVAKDSN